jgi:prepilin-type N-terminal cleavage/methylation domain-containing protein
MAMANYRSLGALPRGRQPVRMVSRARLSAQHGFTLIEVLVAIVILLVGVLGVVALADGANAITSKTRAREGGTHTARSIIEVSRSLRYADLTATSLLDALGSRPGLGDTKPGAVGHTITSRNVDYEVTLTVCSLDDPQDGLGTHTGPIAFCSDTSALGVGGNVTDRNPDDYKRVRVTLNWTTRETGQSITQTSAIINPVGGLGPSVTSLTPTNAANTDPITITDIATDHVSFHVTTSKTAQGVNWSVGGEPTGTATGSLINWDFDWELDNPDGTPLYHDCTYVVQADAYDGSDRSGTPRSRTVVVNRRPPVTPETFGGGRNGSGEYVDLQWVHNPECDIRGYRVYRSDTSGVIGNPITCLGQSSDITEEIDCLDLPPAGPAYYTLKALDLDPAGSLREGQPSTQILIGPATGRPPAPTNVQLCVGDGTGACVDAAGDPAPVGMVVVSWDPSSDPDGIQFYRIYRDGTSFADRYDDYFPQASNPGFAWFEFNSQNGPHEYRITAVDGSFAESDLSASVTG